ncbi:hypothetical protein MVES1_002810 [Malassezia vespertilionis]|uniref:Integral membrane protein n=1 Tax=Malassezia vespertilionis TaxID=2020962 RepID=A0A2N1JAL0_9BASI|nr:uncharacterized protein MVES1_002810 [Malassezia vespertilionis]PKI83532.1 hypothetical protein MVES_002654 [Malassezia vespertilionis]WFD07445.1 hypothetical protein MVES1_002810 [Malassezia vespertilionis]
MPVVEESALPHTNDAKHPMADLPLFCTVPTEAHAVTSNATNTTSECIAMDTIDKIIAADTADLALRPSPNLTSVQMHLGKSHHHTEPAVEFNETDLFIRKGAVPLSYVEWDFAAGAGALPHLRRFASQQADQIAATWPKRTVIAAANGYWRSLADLHYPRQWTSLREDVRSRIGGDQGNQEPSRYLNLAVFVAVQFIVACFMLLPILLCLQSASSSLVPLAAAVYLCMITSAMLFGRLYFALSPELYPPNKLGVFSRAFLFLSYVCFVPDAIRLITRAISIVCDPRACLHSFSGMVGALRELNRGGCAARRAETAPLVLQTQKKNGSHSTTSTDQTLTGSVGASSPHQETKLADGTEVERFLFDRKAILDSPLSSHASEMHDVDEEMRLPLAQDSRLDKLMQPYVRFSKAHPVFTTTLSYVYITVSRGLLPFAFAVLYIAVAIYSGSCRKMYKNVCLAHGIKGAIFFWYGVLSFSRYLGAFGEYGWAWNKRPTLENSMHSTAARWRRNMPSAEFIECFVIFLYGATNTWMERFGAKSGDPYTVKQIQHISIAVMFWFVGLVGMGMESVRVRTLLSRAIVRTHPSALPAQDGDELRAQTPPPSYVASFNPFPALVIGVTGVAMAAHHQDYVYEVQVHMLWGEMLAAFGLLRCLTYFILWLRPPTSVLPSRPPTEALGSFALCCGGLLFILSNEEVSFAAMRADYGDFMAMLNLAVAVVALVFFWIFIVMVVKAWAHAHEFTSTKSGALHAYTQKSRVRATNRAHPWLQEQQFVLSDPAMEASHPPC